MKFCYALFFISVILHSAISVSEILCGCVCVVGIAGVKACCVCGQKCAWQTRCLEMPYAVHCNLLVASCVELGGIYFLEFN